MIYPHRENSPHHIETSLVLIIHKIDRDQSQWSTAMTERPRSGNEQHQKNTGKRRRATRACIPCRRSKVKCDGKEPCARCKDRDVICMLGVDARSRADKKLGGSNEQNVQQGDRPQNSAQTKDQTNLLNREVHCSITGTDVSASSAMHLHYGPSSSFVFL